MPLDPSLFMQYAQLQQRNNENLSNTIGNAAQQYTAFKNKKAEGLDLEKVAQGYAVKTQMGEPTTPQEKAAFDVYQKFESAKIGVDPYTGQTYPKYKPFGLDGTISEAGATGGFDLGTIAPVPPVQKMPDQFVGGTTGPEFDVSSIPKLDVSMLEGDALPNVPAVSDEEFAQTLEKDKGFDLNNVQPMAANPELQIDPSLAQQSPRKAAEAKIDFEKDVQTQKAKIDAEKQGLKPKAEASYMSLLDKSVNIDKNINDAIGMVSPQTAGMGSAIKDVPLVGKGSRAQDLASVLKTIQADSAFAALQEMRDNSPTGGALGNVSEGELQLLQNAASALDQEQSPMQLKKRLEEYKKVRSTALKRVGDAFEKQYGYRPQLDGKAPTESKAQSWEEYFPNARR